MLDFYEKRKMRNLVYSKIVLFFLLLIIFFLSYSVWGVYQKERDTQVKKSQRAQVLTEIRERERELAEEMERLNTERGVEEEIRSKFDVARTGEKVLVIVDAPEDDASLDNEEGANVWQSFLNFFR